MMFITHAFIWLYSKHIIGLSILWKTAVIHNNFVLKTYIPVLSSKCARFSIKNYKENIR